MTTSQMSSDQIRAWLALEGFQLWHRKDNPYFWMLVRNTGNGLPASCKSMNQKDRWEFVMRMTAPDDVPMDMSSIPESDLQYIYKVELDAEKHGHSTTRRVPV